MKTYQCIKKENMSFTLLGVIKKMSFSFLFEWIRIFVLKFHKMLYQLYYHIYTTIYIHIWPSRFKFIFINPPTTPLSYLLTPLPSLLPSSPFSPLVFLHLNPPPPCYIFLSLLPLRPPTIHTPSPFPHSLLLLSSSSRPSQSPIPFLTLSHPVLYSFPSRSSLFLIPFFTLSHPVPHSFPSRSSIFPIPFFTLSHPVPHSSPIPFFTLSLPCPATLHSPTPLLFPSQHSYLFISSLTFYNVHDTS